MLDKFSVDMYDQMRKVDSAEDLSLDTLFDNFLQAILHYNLQTALGML